jgi:hypothetical protein
LVLDAATVRVALEKIQGDLTQGVEVGPCMVATNPAGVFTDGHV